MKAVTGLNTFQNIKEVGLHTDYRTTGISCNEILHVRMMNVVYKYNDVTPKIVFCVVNETFNSTIALPFYLIQLFFYMHFKNSQQHCQE